MTQTLGPDFLALQVRDLQRAVAFYEHQLGLTRAPGAPPAWSCSPPRQFRSESASRCRVPTSTPGHPGSGSVSLRVDDAQALHDTLKAHGTPILTAPFDTP